MTELELLKSEVNEIKQMLAVLSNHIFSNSNSIAPLIKPCKYTFAEWLAEWSVTYKKPKYTDRSYENLQAYIGDINRKLGNIKLNEITTNALQNYLISLGKTNKQVKVASVLSDSLRKAYNIQLIPHNPYLAVEFERHQSEHFSPLQPHEQIKFFNSIKEKKYYSLFFFCCCTGLRISEALGLKVADIDFTRGVIKVCRAMDRDNEVVDRLKTKASNREVPFISDLFKIVKVDKKAERLFEGINYNSASCYIKRLKKKIGMEHIVLHSFRHTFISVCYHIGVKDKQIQRWAGHSKVETTMNVYTEILEHFSEKSGVANYIEKLAKSLKII